MTKIKYTFPSGAQVEVDSVEKLKAIAKALGEPLKLDKTYNSTSKGLIFIRDMDTKHIIRTIRKHTNSLLDDSVNKCVGLAERDAARAFYVAYTNMPADQLLSDLFEELGKRV